MCKVIEKSGIFVPHDCRKNCVTSSKAMEAEMSVEMVKSIKEKGKGTLYISI